jgi:isoleucyl-tRNA synthetase
VVGVDGTSADLKLTRLEEDSRRFWQWYGVAEATRIRRVDGPAVQIVQQPPEVVGDCWLDQVRLLATADLMTRYRTMKGMPVMRWAGWSCHGLPVEVAVESALPRESGRYGLEQLNAACREAVGAGVRQAVGWSERLGVWLDPADTYTTLEPRCTSALWGGLRRLWDAGRFGQQEVVAPVCPRCGTPLSAGEAARRSVEVEATAAWVRLPWDGEADTYFLAWTEAPWMLIGLVALAVHPGASYVLVERREHPDLPPMRLVLAEPTVERALLPGYRVVRRLSGRALRGTRYRPLFTFVPSDQGSGPVIQSTQVPLDLGTGIWPVTPSFEPLSLDMARLHRLPVPDLLDERGRLGSPVTPWQGLVPYDAEPLLVDDLRARGLLVQRQPVRRVQSHCPFCDARLLPLARSVWKVDTEDGIWIIGRDRSWGAPLPIWVCDTCAKQVCVAGLDDLAHRTGQEASSIDAHRPAIDRLVFSCDACGGSMRRVPEVADAAFETAVVACSRAQEAGPGGLAVGLPGREGWLDVLRKTLGLLEGKQAAYQVISPPAVPADSSLDPDRPALSDALRWAAYTGTTPELAERSFLRPLWHLALALHTQQAPDGELQPDSEFLGRWLRARVAKATDVVSHALDNADLKQATGELACLVDEAVRYCLPGQTDGGASALDALSRLLAPFVPHMAEAMHRLTVLRAGDSVHLVRWPDGEAGAADDEILALLAGFQHLVACGRLARGRHGVALETKLPAAVVGRLAPQPSDLPGAALGVLARVLNVGQVEVVRNLPPHVGWRLALTSDGGARRAVASGEIEASLAALDSETASTIVAQLWQGLSVSLDMAGRTVTLLPQEVEVGLEAQPGWAVAGSDGWIVALQIA